MQLLFEEPSRVYERDDMVCYNSIYDERPEENAVIFSRERGFVFSRINGMDIESISELHVFIAMKVTFDEGGGPLFYTLYLERHGLSWKIAYMEADI